MTEQSTISDICVSLANLIKAAYLLPLSRSRPSSIPSEASASADSWYTESASTNSASTRASLDEEVLEQSSTSQSAESNQSMKIGKQQDASEHPSSTTTQVSSLCRDTPKESEKTKSGVRERLKLLIKKAIPGKEECTGCDKQIPSGRLVIAPCDHRYCQQCIREMAHVALKNTDLFPVRCCSQEIPARQVAATLLSEERDTYTSRSEEHTLPPAERWYCPQTRCGQWIRPRYLRLGSRAPKCPYCKTSLCPNCRDIAHEDRRCESDPKLTEILKVARRHRWQRCYNCHTMVEKTSGCNHMKCVCSAEFCYSCSRRWPCNCRGTTEVVENDAELAADPDIDTTTVVAAMEQAEREVAEDAIIQDENFRQRPRLQDQALWQVEQQAIRLHQHVEDFVSRRLPAGSR